MKIALLIDHLGLGGAQKQFAKLAIALHEGPYEVRVLCFEKQDSDHKQRMLQKGISITEIDHSGKWSWKTLSCVHRFLGDFRPGIVHTWLFTSDLYGQLAAFLKRVPGRIVALRNTLDDVRWHQRLAYRTLMTLASVVTVNANAIRFDLFSRLGVPHSKIKTIYNYVETDHMDRGSGPQNLRSECKIEADSPIITMIARCSKQKDYLTFIRAARRVRDHRPSACFLIVGSGPQTDQIQQWIKEMDLEGAVRMMGRREDVREILLQSDLSVLSSRFEGCSNVIMESMAAGIPVIATHVGGNAELVLHGQNGYLVPPGSDDMLAEKILDLLQAPDKAAQLGQNARQRVRELFGFAHTFKNTTDLYSDLTQTGKRDHVRVA